MNTLKSIGGTLLGIAIFIGIIVATVLFFTLGAKVAFTIAPFINWLAGILFAINLLLLFFAIIPKARGIVGLIIYISSYVYGLSAWIYGLAVTLALWGWIAVIIGLFLGGVGVVPIGMQHVLQGFQISRHINHTFIGLIQFRQSLRHVSHQLRTF